MKPQDILDDLLLVGLLAAGFRDLLKHHSKSDNMPNIKYKYFIPIIYTCILRIYCQWKVLSGGKMVTVYLCVGNCN